MIKLTLLGTSHGVPSEIRYCSCYMLEVKDRIYIFDGGAPVTDLLLRKNKDLTTVKAFFNTHFHSDHITGALSMFSLFEWYYKETDIDIFLPDEKSKNAITNYLEAADCVNLPSERVRMSVYGAGVVFNDGVIRVSAIPVNHFCGENNRSNAFLIECEGKSILYTGDMSAQLNDFPEIAYEKYIDMIISECAHQPAEVLLEKMKKINTEAFVITHLWPLDKMDVIEKESARFNYRIYIAADNMEFVL